MSTPPDPRDGACGSPGIGGPCRLTAGHNMGNVDIPENHDGRRPTNARLEKAYWAGFEFGRKSAERAQELSIELGYLIPATPVEKI